MRFVRQRGEVTYAIVASHSHLHQIAASYRYESHLLTPALSQALRVKAATGEIAVSLCRNGNRLTSLVYLM